jgi:20S proteasome alpha/beta subunit
VTIIAGFRCSDGVVVCADTQETMSVGDISISKRKVPKLRFENNDGAARVLAGKPDIAVAVCGAGYGPFIDKLADELWKTASYADDLSSACEGMEQRIKEIYTEYGQIYQAGKCPEVDLLYGIKSQGESRLFYANGPIVNEKDGYYAAGSGSYMADYIASSMYDSSLTVRQCVILAAYVLAQTKEYADGCGGDSHIAVLREQGASGQLGWSNTDSITRLVQDSNREVGHLLIEHANLSLSDEEFIKKAHKTIDDLKCARSAEREKLKDWDDLWHGMFSGLKFDDLGLVEGAVEDGDSEQGAHPK